jgi:hypothetical protein
VLSLRFRLISLIIGLMFDFAIAAKNNRARAGIFITPHARE